MRFSRFAVMLLGATLVSGCAAQNQQAQGPQAAPAASPMAIQGATMSPVWQVGEKWTYSDGYGLKVSHVDGDMTTFQRTDRPGSWIKRRGLFKEESQSSTTHRQVVYRTRDPQELFPLEVGKQSLFTREYLADGQLMVHQTSWTVEGRETITVPAGRFDCWVLVWRSQSIKTDWNGYEKWWYSPEVKNFVRMEYKYGKSPFSSRVLMDYQPAGH